jgi:mono/diheme cytochrome c family protein
MKTLAAAVVGSVLVVLPAPSRVHAPISQPGYEGPRSGQPTTPDETSEAYTAVIRRYCVSCHGGRQPKGNLSLRRFDVAEVTAEAETTEKIIRKLRAGMMPPPGKDRPEGDTLTAMVAYLEATIDEAAAAAPDPGHRTFQRLNRAEYAASVKDLLALDIDAGAYLPLDTKSANFDNIADVQLLSPTLMDAYLTAAGEISRLAVGDPDASPSETTYKVPRLASQTDHAEGAPFGTRGGTSVIHNFPADGEYVFRIMLHATPTGLLFGRTSTGERLEVSVDGARVALLDIDRWKSQSDPDGMNVQTEPVQVRAGPHRVSAAFIPTAEGPVEDVMAPIGHSLADTRIGLAYGITTVPHLRDLVVSGPYNVTGVSDTPTRGLVFTCRPTSPAEERACAEEIVTRLGTQAYRRPLEARDTEALLSFFEEGAAEGGFEIGVRTALQAILASPHFLFRFEEQVTPAGPEADVAQAYRISDLDLASRLSFFLWSTPPDEELVGLASLGQLSEPAALEEQVRRMLADPRSEALGTRFAAQWLRLQDLAKVHPDALKFPDFDQQLADAMRRETELFFNSLVREDRSVYDLVDADYSIMNERLASHYGISGVTGDQFRRVAYPDETRRGLLGHGSVLTLTSHANRTSATDGAREGKLLTTRERMELHRANPVCASCHLFMDPIGLALDNFDVTGQWRIRENGMPLDTRGELYDGTPVQTPRDLRQAMLERPTPWIRTFTENPLAYGLGRRVEYFDQPTVRGIVRDAEAQEHRMSAYILGVVNSPAFQMKSNEAIADDADDTVKSM